jgi:plastocyanin
MTPKSTATTPQFFSSCAILTRMKYRYALVFIVAVILIGFVSWKAYKSTKQSPRASQIVKKQVSLPKEITITLDKNGFSPKEVTISVGSAIRWKNVSGDKQTVNSDEYPTNQLHRELNFGVFNNGSSVVHTFTKPGTYGYHNQFHHEQIGKILVTR